MSKKGRPKGARNKSYERGLSLPSQCPKCHSTERTVVKLMATVRFVEREEEGRLVNACSLHRVKCDACGQHRVDRTLQHKPEAL